jgi:hypothetical protein
MAEDIIKLIEINKISQNTRIGWKTRRTALVSLRKYAAVLSNFKNKREEFYYECEHLNSRRFSGF